VVLEKISLEDYEKALQDACAYALAAGMTVVEAKPDQLFCDLDNKFDRALFAKRSEALVSNGIAKSWRVTRSKSGNQHGYVTLSASMPAVERIALQSVLGSDRTHEYLNFLSYKKLGEDVKIVFFEPAEVA
jgi:hypothetical protein